MHSHYCTPAQNFMTNRLITYICMAISLATALSAHAQDGTSAYSFLNISPSSRIYGLGGMNISIVGGDVNSADQNPALLGQEMNNEVQFSYMRYIGSSNFAGVSYAHSIGAHGTWGAAIRYLGYGSMTEADESGNITGTFSASDAIFSATYSHDITDRLRGGINLKMAYSSYAEFSAMAIATDIGINYYDGERDLSLSVVIANLGGQVKRFDNRYDKLPLDLRLGWSQTFGSLPIRFSITAWNLTKWKLPYIETGDGTSDEDFKVKDSFSSNLFRHLVFGADFVGSDNFYIGLGYNYKTRTDMSTYSRSILSGFSLSAGLRVRAFDLGVAFAQPHTGATTFMFNLSCDISYFIE